MKIIIIISALTITTACSAASGFEHESQDKEIQWDSSDTNCHTGFYGTTGVGYSTGRSKIKRTRTGVPASDKSDLGLSGIQLHLGLGYGHVLTPYLYTGLKGTFALTHVKGRDSFLNTGAMQHIVRLRQKNSGNLVANFGVPLKRSLPYIAVGGAYSKWNLTSDSNTPFFARPHAEKTSTLFGYVFGAGADFTLHKHCTVGIEYLYTVFNRISLFHNTALGNIKIRPVTGAFNLTLKIKT